MSRSERIGDATLYLGDCREILPMLTCVDAVVTDPPYGVDLGSAPAHRIGNVAYATFSDTPEQVQKIVVPVIRYVIEMSRSVIVTPGTRCAWFYPVPQELGAIFFPAGAGFSRWGFTCSQPILYYGIDSYMPRNKKPNSVSSTEISEKNGHPCPKPERLTKWLVERASISNDVVLDPFMGSGTTGVACARLGRSFIGIEIHEPYFDIACRRIEEAQRQKDLFIHTPVEDPADTRMADLFREPEE